MFFGYLENVKYEYLRMGTDIPLEPEYSPENGAMFWDWRRMHGSALDIRVTLDGEYFVGAVYLRFSGYTKIYRAEVRSGDKILGVHSAETGKFTTRIDPIAIGEKLNGFVIRLYDAMSTITVDEIRISAAKEDGEPLLWPTPKSARISGDAVEIGKIEAADECGSAARALLCELIEERSGGLELSPTGIAARLSIDEEYPKERLTISVTSEKIEVKAGGRLALLRAVSTLASTMSEAGMVPVMEIDDEPTLAARGFHMGLPSRENIPFVKRLFKYILLPTGYNQLFVQFCGGMRYERHPEITEGWLKGNRLFKEGLGPRFPHDYMGAEGGVLEKHEVGELLDYARELGFEIIPEVQSLGHVQYLTYSHPEIGEVDEDERQVDDTRVEDLRPDQKFIHCYCPQNEMSYKLIFDIIDEVIEVSRPERYLHIGHDEVYHLGLCPRCRGKSHTELFVSDVMRLYEYLKSRGLGTMMWADMLQPVTKYDTKQSIDLLPKDIVQLDFIWYFHMDDDVEDNLTAAGYEVILGNLYSSHFPRYKERALKEGVIGGQLSTWCAPNEREMAERGKLWDTVYTAQLLMRPELCESDMRTVYGHLIAKYVQPKMREALRGSRAPLNYERQKLSIERRAGCHLPKELLEYRADAALAEESKILVSGCFKRLALEQATLNIGLKDPWSSPEICGSYTVFYEDGTECTVPIGYSAEVWYLYGRYGEPRPEAAHRHYGYACTWLTNPTLEETLGDGKRLLLTEYLWDNPYPDKKITQITYKSAGEDFTRLVLCSAYGLNQKK